MFEHENFQVYEFDDIPLNRDCYLMGGYYIKEYEQELLECFAGGECKNVGYISYISVRRINNNSLELSWYPNIFNRFHEVPIILPKKEIIICVGCSEYDVKPHLFVNDNWLNQLYLKHYSIFAMIDAIGVKDAIQSGSLSKTNLVKLREEIDNIAKEHSKISFISFADSILLKSNWTVGHIHSDVGYTYHPEVFVQIFPKIRSTYKEILGLNIYGVFTQGSNEYYDENILHISPSNNHICLNSLGVLFADLLAIDETARRCIRDNIHTPCDLYMDSLFYHSLKFRFGFEKHKTPRQNYPTPMRLQADYYYCQCEDVLSNLDEDRALDV